MGRLKQPMVCYQNVCNNVEDLSKKERKQDFQLGFENDVDPAPVSTL